MPSTSPRALERVMLIVIVVAIGFAMVSSGARGRPPESDPPRPPTDLSLVSVATSEIGLSWRASPRSVRFKAFLDGEQVAGSLRETSFVFTGLSCGTSYEIGIAASDHWGNTSEPETVVAATVACGDTEPPSQVTGLRSVSRDVNSMTFAWDASTDNVAVAGYRILLAGTVLASIRTTSYTYAPAFLVCGASYEFGVQAFDASGNAAPSSVAVQQSVPCGDNDPPTAPTSVHVGKSTETSLAVSWKASTDNVGVTRYDVVAGAVSGTTTGTTHDLLGLTCGTSYTVQVTARDAAGNSSPPAQVPAKTSACPAPPSPGVGDKQPPTAPTGLLSSAATTSSVQLAWTSSTDNLGVAGYAVYRDGVQVATTPVAGYTLTGLVCASSYTVGVEAYDAAGNRSSRTQAVVPTAVCPDTQKPGAPQVALGGKTDSTLTLVWTPPTDKAGVVDYRLYRNGLRAGHTSQRTYTFTTLACATTYVLGVTAVDAAGNESAAGSLTVATSACPTVAAPPAPTGIAVSNVTETSLTASWTSSGGTTAGFSVYLGDTLVASTQASTYSFSGLTCGASYVVGVAAYDTAGTRSTRLSLGVTTSACAAGPPPSSPPPSGSGLYVTTGGSDTNPCTQTQPCRSFGRAYKAASAGATVYVGAGTYPAQEISDDPAKQSGAPVVFQPSGGAVAVNGTLDFGQDQFGRKGPKGVTIKDMTITYLHAWPGSERLTWENIDAVHFDMDAVDSVVRGGDYGPCQAPRDDPSCLSRILGNSRNVLVENAAFHNITSTDLANFHVDGFAVFGGANVTLRGNTFYGNMITNIRVQTCCGNTPISNLVIENNWFAAPLQGDGVSTNANGIDIDSTVPGLKIRFNSFAEGGYPQITGSQGDAELTGNLLTQATCVGGVKYSYNVFKPWSETQGQSPCGSTDKKVSTLGYASGGFALSSTSPAIDAVPSSVGCPQEDLEGTSRPLGAACDAGASEIR